MTSPPKASKAPQELQELQERATERRAARMASRGRCLSSPSTPKLHSKIRTRGPGFTCCQPVSRRGRRAATSWAIHWERCFPPKRRTRAAWGDAAERSAESPVTSNAATSPEATPTSKSSWVGEKRASSRRSSATHLRPVYVDGTHKFTTTKANFDQWYRNVDGVNKPYLVYLVVEPNGIVFTFESEEFFPLDGQGWGNEGFNPDHNFAFTTEFTPSSSTTAARRSASAATTTSGSSSTASWPSTSVVCTR